MKRNIYIYGQFMMCFYDLHFSMDAGRDGWQMQSAPWWKVFSLISFLNKKISKWSNQIKTILFCEKFPLTLNISPRQYNHCPVSAAAQPIADTGFAQSHINLANKSILRVIHLWPQAESVCGGVKTPDDDECDDVRQDFSHPLNSIRSLLQTPFDRRTLAEKVKELWSNQPDIKIR